MSHPATEDDTFPVTVPVPDINDITYTDIVPQGLADLASRTKWLARTLAGSEGTTEAMSESDVVPLDSTINLAVPLQERSGLLRSLSFSLLGKIRGLRERQWGANPVAALMNVPIVPMYGATLDGTTGFGSILSSNRVFWRQNDVTGPPSLIWAAHGLPLAGTIAGVQLQVSGQPGSHAALPATLPKIELWKQTDTSIVPTLIGTGTDTSASKAAYEALHAIQTGAFEESIDSTATYLVHLYGEASTNSVAFGLYVYRCMLLVSD